MIVNYGLLAFVGSDKMELCKTERIDNATADEVNHFIDLLFSRNKHVAHFSVTAWLYTGTGRNKRLTAGRFNVVSYWDTVYTKESVGGVPPQIPSRAPQDGWELFPDDIDAMEKTSVGSTPDKPKRTRKRKGVTTSTVETDSATAGTTSISHATVSTGQLTLTGAGAGIGTS